MFKRIALFVGSIAAAGVLALGLAAAGFGPVSRLPGTGTTGATGDPANPDAGAAQRPAEPVVQVQTETVYVKPAPAPKVIHVTRKLPAAKPRVITTTRRPTRAASGGGDDNGYEHDGQDG